MGVGVEESKGREERAREASRSGGGEEARRAEGSEGDQPGGSGRTGGEVVDVVEN